MKKCPHCAEEIQDEAIKCRHCGESLDDKRGMVSDGRGSSKTKIKPLTIVGLIFLGLIVLGVISSSTSNKKQEVGSASAGAKAVSDTQTKGGLTVVSFDWSQGEYGNRILAGTVKNNSDKEYSYVQIEFNLYDQNGSQVGSTFTNINNLEAGGTWKFEASVIEDTATQAKVKGITGF